MTGWTVLSGSRWRSVAAVCVIVAALSTSVLVGDMVLLSRRLGHVDVRFPRTGEGATWVLVGSDSRTAVPGGPHLYGTASQAPGSHADAVLVVHQHGGVTTVLSVPRDTLVSPRPGEISRLTLTLDEGPQQLVDGLCRTLHIPASHLVIIDMRAFARAVDVLGGVTVTSPTAVRDPWSGLSIAAGRVDLDGIEALAMVRSRHPQRLTPTGWVSSDPAQGDADRTAAIGATFRALARQARRERTDPIVVQRLAWDLTGGLTTDRSTGLLALSHLDVAATPVVDLPVRVLGPSGTGATADGQTYSALAAAGYSGTCRTG